MTSLSCKLSQGDYNILSNSPFLFLQYTRYKIRMTLRERCIRVTAQFRFHKSMKKIKNKNSESQSTIMKCEYQRALQQDVKLLKRLHQSWALVLFQKEKQTQMSEAIHLICRRGNQCHQVHPMKMLENAHIFGSSQWIHNACYEAIQCPKHETKFIRLYIKTMFILFSRNYNHISPFLREHSTV